MTTQTPTKTNKIPRGWTEKRLGELSISIASGKSNTLSEDGEFPIFGSTGIIGHKKYHEYSGKKILVARVGANAGTVNMVKGDYCVSDNTLIIDFKKEINIDFHYYHLINYGLQKLVFGSGQPLITGGHLKQISILTPTLLEQTAIVAVLETWDQAITALQTKISTKSTIKKGLMQSLLTGQKRLPGFGEPWSKKSISEIAETKSGGTPNTAKKEFYENGNIPWLSSGEVRQGYVSEFKNFITELALKNSSAKLFPINTVLVAMYGVTAGQIGYLLKESSTNQAICGIILNEGYCSKFLYQYLKTQTNTLLDLSTGAAQPNISQGIIRDLILSLPSLPEQQAIAEVLNTCDDEIEALRRQLSLLQSQKKYLLGGLVTGAIRLPEFVE